MDSKNQEENTTPQNKSSRIPPLNWSPGINAMLKITQMRRSQSALMRQKKFLAKNQQFDMKMQQNSINQNNLAQIQIRCATEYIKSFDKHIKPKALDFFGDDDSDSPETEFYRCCLLKTRLYDSIKQLQMMKLKTNQLESQYLF